MLFVRIRAFVLSALILIAFGAFLLYKLDLYVKNEATSTLDSQISNVAKVAFQDAMIINDGNVHNYNAIDTLQGQKNLQSVWISRNDEISKAFYRTNTAFKDQLERKVYVTKTTEIELKKVQNTNDYIVRISSPVLVSKSCLICHTNLKVGDVAGSINAEYLLPDNIMAIYRSMELELLCIIAAASIIMTIVLLSNIHSFTATISNFKTAIQAASSGDFSFRIKNRDINIFEDSIKVVNKFLDSLDRSINSIDVKIGSIFIYNKSLYNKNPLIRIGELVGEITNMFLFKAKVETFAQLQEVYRELQLVILRYAKYKYLIFAESIDGVIASGYKIAEDVETAIVAGDVNDIKKRLSNPNAKVIFSKDKNCVFVSTSTDSLDVIDISIKISDNFMLYYGIVLHSKSDLLDREKSVIRVYNYIREASPYIANIALIQSIKDSSYKDPLTKAYNRMYLEKYSNNVSMKLAQHIGFGVLMLDIDHFKRVNDTYGHSVGDAGIVLLTETIKKLIRPTDKLFRYGGEEFVVVLEGYDIDETQRMAEKICSSFSLAKKCSLMEITFPHSVSIGLSCIPDFSHSLWECINQADVALYKAKASGRNKVIKFSRELEEKEKLRKADESTQKEQSQNTQTTSHDDVDDDEDSFLESLKLNS